MANRLTARLRESVAATQLPQLQRGEDDPELDAADGETAAEAKPKKKKRNRESFRLLLREAAITKTGGAYEATIVREGPGNPSDSNYYTPEALREAVRTGLFEGLQAYANHPTATEERDRPERDVRALVGHFREARFIAGHPAEVRAKFIPVSGAGYEWVTSLIESALAAPKNRPLIGISIDGYGHAPDQQTIGGRTYNMVREVTHLGSADIVTRAGAGGMFHRRLQEAWRTHTPALQAGHIASKEVRMKPAKLQEKVKAALADLEKAAGLTDEHGDEADRLVTNGMATLREAATARLKEKTLTTKDRKDLKKSDFAVPSKKPGSGSYPIPDEAHARDALARVAADGTPEEQAEVRAAVKKKFPDIKVGGSKKSREADTGDPAMSQDNAELTQLREKLAKAERKLEKSETRVSEYERRDLATKVLREAEIDEKLGRIWAKELLSEETEEGMVALVERKREELDIQTERLRETLGTPAIEGAGPRIPSLTGAAAVTSGLLERMGIDRDELAGN